MTAGGSAFPIGTLARFPSQRSSVTLATVVDALHLRRYALLGVSQGAAIAIAHAARYPERISKMILHGGFALGRNKRSAKEAELGKAWVAIMREAWEDDNSALLRIFSSVWLPGATAEQIKWYANLLRLSTSLENAVRIGSPLMKSTSSICCRKYPPPPSSCIAVTIMQRPSTRGAALPRRFRAPNS